MSNAILGNQLLIQLCEAAGVDPDKTQRSILDAAVGDVVHVYVQMIGTVELLDIDFGAEPLKVNILQKDDGK